MSDVIKFHETENNSISVDVSQKLSDTPIAHRWNSSWYCKYLCFRAHEQKCNISLDVSQKLEQTWARPSWGMLERHHL